MSQQHADGLIVASGFDAAGGETVAQTVIFQLRDIETFHQTVVIIAVCAGLCRTFVICQHIEVLIDYLFQRFDHGQQFLAQGDFPAGVSGLGRIDDK